MARKAARRHFGFINTRKTSAGRNRYTAQYTRPDNGQRATLGTYSTRAAAEVALHDVELAIDRDEWTEDYGKAQPEAPRTLGDAWEEYLTRRTKPLAASTLQNYRGSWERDIKPYWGTDRALDKITKDDVWAWRNGPLAGAQRKDNAALALLKQILRAAISWDWIDKNPTDGISLPRTVKTLAERRAFDLPDIMEYLSHAQPNDHAKLATLALAGLRSGELRALERGHIDLEGKTINVVQAVADGQDADGNKVLELKPPKSKAGVRNVPISDTLASALRQHLADNPSLPRALVFPGRDGGIMSSSALERAHYRTLERMGLRTPKAELERLRRAGKPRPEQSHLKLHDLRASYAALLFQQGYTVPEVMLVMGWDDPAMPQKIYARVFPQRTANMGAKIDAAIAEARKAAQ